MPAASLLIRTVPRSAAAFAVIVCLACRPEQPPTSASAAPKPTPTTTRTPAPTASDARTQVSSQTLADPGSVVRALHDARVAGDYAAMGAFIEPDSRPAVISLVLSVDELIGAERHLQAIVTEKLGEGSAARLTHRRGVANILGPLSYQVEVKASRYRGADKSEATVSVQVADRLPLEQVTLRRDGDVWLVFPDRPVPGLAEEIRHLAALTRKVAREFGEQPTDIDDLLNQLGRRQQRIMRRIQQLVADAGVAAAP